MTRPSFANVEAAYPRKSIKRADLYAQYGWSALVNVPAYENTCGMRMSVALFKAGVILTKGGLRVQEGPYRGQRAEASMRKLAENLAELWGPPEKFANEAAARAGIGQRKGVVAFFFAGTLPGLGAQGHIDIVKSGPTGYSECAGACYFAPHNQVWFWPLD